MADANRTISIRMVLEDQEFKSQLKEISNDMNLHRSELEKVKSEYIGQQNTLSALSAKYAVYDKLLSDVNNKINVYSAKNKQLKDTLATIPGIRNQINESLQRYTERLEMNKVALQEYQKIQKYTNETYNETKEKYDNAKKALEEFEEKYTGTTRNFPWYQRKHEELTKAVEGAKREHEYYTQVLSTANRNVAEATFRGEEYDKQIKGLKSDLVSLDNQEKDINKQYTNNVAAMNRLAAEGNNYATTMAQMKVGMDDCIASGKGVTDMFDPFTGEMKKANETAEALAQTLALKLVKEGFNVVKEAVTSSVDAFKEYETALAGVSKTTGMEWGGEEIKTLGEDFKQLSMELPVSAKELLNVAQIAGQLGIQGSEDIQKFTKVMAQMSVSTNLSAEEAATAMAQMAAVTGMAASDYDKLGSAVVALGNKFPTSEDVIIRIAQRFSGAATNASLAESSIVALAAAAGSVGLQAESAGTSLSKLIQKMGTAVESEDELAAWAKVANMEAEEFAKLWGEDASQAVVKFLEGFGKLGPQATSTFKELGIGEARLQDLIRRMANAEATSGLLSRALREANDAFKEGVALENEANVAFETLNSKVEVLKNSVDVLGIDVGTVLAPQVAALAEGATDVVQIASDLIEKYPQIVRGLEGITIIFGVLVADKLPTAIPLLGKVLDCFKGLSGLFSKSTIADGIASAANGIVTFGTAALPVIGIVTALAAAIAALVWIADKYGEDGDVATQKTQHVSEAYETQAEVAEALAEAEKTLFDLKQQYIKEEVEVGEVTQETSDKLETQQAYVDLLREAYNALAPEVEEVAEAEQAFAYTTLENTQKIKELTEAFADNISKVKDFSTNYTATAKSYIEDIEQQIKWHDTYASNREKLLSRDIEGLEEWVATWDNGTEEAAKKMAAFAGATDEQILYLINTLLPGLAEASKKVNDSAEQEFKEAWDNIHWYAKDRLDKIQYEIDQLHGKDIVIRVTKSGNVLNGGMYDVIAAQGLDYVPYDGFVSMLHEGEKVLNRAEASAYRKLERTVTNTTNNNNNNNVVLNVYGGKGQSADELSDIIMKKIQQATNRRQAVWA